MSWKPQSSPSKQEDMDAYWKENLKIITILLVIWFVVSYVPVLIVNQLNQITFLTGFPLGYYMGSQGSLIVFVIEIFFYAWWMGKLDRRFGLDQK